MNAAQRSPPLQRMRATVGADQVSPSHAAEYSQRYFGVLTSVTSSAKIAFPPCRNEPNSTVFQLLAAVQLAPRQRSAAPKLPSTVKVCWSRVFESRGSAIWGMNAHDSPPTETPAPPQ